MTMMTIAPPRRPVLQAVVDRLVETYGPWTILRAFVAVLAARRAQRRRSARRNARAMNRAIRRDLGLDAPYQRPDVAEVWMRMPRN